LSSERANPFGLGSRSVVVLDKSFLDATGLAQLLYFVEKEWSFAIPEVLMFELLRKEDRQRAADLAKLDKISKHVVALPGIGEMFRAEARRRKPATEVLKAKQVTSIGTPIAGGKSFELSPAERRATDDRKREVEEKGADLIEVWRALGQMEALKGASSTDLPERLDQLAMEVRDDRPSMRGFYVNHKAPVFPPAKLIDEKWALFRWIQVYLVAGLDFYRSYGLRTRPNAEKVMHEILDLDYIIPALLIGGIATCEKRMKKRFQFLRPDGVALSIPQMTQKA